MLLHLVLACQLDVILSAVSYVAFPAITSKGLLEPNTTNSTNAVPVECQQTCAPIVPLTLGNQSCTPSLCCSSEWEQTYYSCILCAAEVQQIFDLSDAQHTLDVIVADCAKVGRPIPFLTFPGQSPNRTLPSAAVLPSTATATVPGNVTTSASLSTSGSSTNLSSSFSSTFLSSTASLTTAPSSNPTSKQNSGASTRSQWSVQSTFLILSIAFSHIY